MRSICLGYLYGIMYIAIVCFFIMLVDDICEHNYKDIKYKVIAFVMSMLFYVCFLYVT